MLALFTQIFDVEPDSDLLLPLYEAKKFFTRTLSKTKYAALNVRGLEYNITLTDVMNLYKKQKGKCALTGLTLEFTRGGSYDNGTNPKVATIDRINNDVGYVKSNIQIVCWLPNSLKGSLNNQEFIDLCKMVTEQTKYFNETDTQ